MTSKRDQSAPHQTRGRAWGSIILSGSRVRLSPTKKSRTAVKLRASRPLYSMLVSKTLHPGMVWSAAALGRDPADVLLRVLDLASFTVQAVLRVDLETRHAFRL
jgi:hypothetical protein